MALSTGRALSELWPHLNANPAISYVIGESGGCLYNAARRETIRQILLPDDSAEAILRAARDYDVCYQVFFENQSYMAMTPGADLARYHIGEFEPAFRAGSLFVDDILDVWRAHDGRTEKINLYFASGADKERFRPVLAPMRLGVFDSMGVGFEISPAEATKAAGLAALCAHLGVAMEDAMAVGDGGNDVDIMAAAGFSVAMGNAIPEVKALADAVTDDCDHDGAAKAIERYMGLA